jgi:soluble lytic murein transglycosylase-like protein
MRARLLALLLVAAASGAVTALESASPAEESATAAPRVVSAKPVSTAPAPVQARDPRCPIPWTFRRGFEDAARQTALPLALLAALGQIESEFRHDAVSGAGAQGLLQIMPMTAQELEIDAAHPDANVLGGARYLRRMLDRFNSTDLALAAYNAGPTAVAKAGGAPTGETLTYVADVTGRWRALVGCR